MSRAAEILTSGLRGPPRGWSLGQAALTLGVLALLAWTVVSLGDVTQAIRAAAAIWTKPELLAVFVVSYSAAFALRAGAWAVLLGKPRPGLPRLFGALQVALLANHVFPTKVGEVVRVGLLVRAGTSVARATSSTVVARLLDLGSLCALAVIGVALSGAHGGAEAVALGGADGGLQAFSLILPLVALFVGVALVVAVGRGAARPLVDRLPVLAPLEGALRDMRPARALLAFGITLPSWALEGLALWTVAAAAGVELSLPLAVAATAFTIAFQGFQVTPGGIGLYEASLTAALSLYGIDPSTALALALATHALKFAYSFAVGLPAAFAEVLPRPTLRLRLGVAEGAFALAIVLAVSAGKMATECAVGALATLPFFVAAKCHHLPRHLRALLLAPVGVYLWIFGPVSPVAVGAERPLEVAGLGLASLIGLVLARQCWLARHPLPPPMSLRPDSLIAVVIPVHDEQASIGQVVSAVPRAGHVRVIVVDDGSNDASAALAVQAGADEVVQHRHRLGLGAALRSGLAAARRAGAEAVVYLDGDGEYDPRDLPVVLAPIVSGAADYVLGARSLDAPASMLPARRIGNRLFTLLLCVLGGRWVRDGQTGFRAFGPRALAAAEIIHDYNYAQVLTLDLLRKRLRLAEVPISYAVRRNGRSFVRYHEYALRVLPAMAREVLSA